MYLILHGFSRRNAGDGLLVDLTLEPLEAAGIARDDCALLALDPESFGDLARVHRAVALGTVGSQRRPVARRPALQQRALATLARVVVPVC